MMYHLKICKSRRIILSIIGTCILQGMHAQEEISDVQQRRHAYWDSIPKSIDLREYVTDVRDQGNRGTCSFFALIGLVESAIKINYGRKVNLSEEYLNYATKSTIARYAHEEESSITVDATAMEESGVLLEDDWPYQPSWFTHGACQHYDVTDSAAPISCYTHNSPPKEILSKKIKLDFSLISIRNDSLEIVRHLLEKKTPLAFNFALPEEDWPDSGAFFFVDSLEEACLEEGGDYCGNHILLLTGFDMNKRVFYLKNSWGKTWGNEGYGTISFADAKKYGSKKLYYLKLFNEPKIPDDKTKKEISVEELSATATKRSDQSVNVNISAKLKDVGRNFLFIRCILVKQIEDLDGIPSTKNTEEVTLTEDEQDRFQDENVRTGWYLTPSKFVKTMNLTKSNSINLVFSPPIMRTETVSDLRAGNEKLFFKINLYECGDDVDFELLKRIFIPVP